MTLAPRGIIAAVEIVFYIPVAALTLFLTFRHGFKRDQGWIYLLIFSAIRVVGSALLLAADTGHSSSSGVLTTAFILESIGLSPLMLATLMFLAIVVRNAPPSVPLQNVQIFRLLRIAIMVALILAIAGATQGSSQGTGRSGVKEASGVVFLVVYGIIAALHVVYWVHKDYITRYRRFLLLGISTALPFLGIRALYSLLSALSPINFTGSAPTGGTSSLSKFNVVSGEWQIYLGMSLIMEFCVVIIYCVVGTMLPLRWNEEEDAEMGPFKPYGS